MKHSRDNSTGQNKTVPNTHRPQPQNKDDIDSRSNEEWDTKGDDVTHNRKEKQSDRKNVKND
ncbi:hypothetical protein [Flavisolibacter ginsenosidimutans]|uniref:Uncharacterized protein n=1 Tax=Flavisolibacter ginsenosidimutans TaxID=661481 RepID=A0A5B8UGC3_9BACT|nr:hypothetical protein [Flavisolibacter ginsenosidimutans]QEC55189.1 hypothetical protein FSB75_04465 [Flavisolibacter ginsenosidimutans]